MNTSSKFATKNIVPHQRGRNAEIQRQMPRQTKNATGPTKRQIKTALNLMVHSMQPNK